MYADDLKDSPVGRLVPILDGALGFVPTPLPHGLNLPPEIVHILDESSRAVAMLAGVGETVVSPSLLIGPFLNREAVLSSRIEGTQASIADIYAAEAGAAAPADVREVRNYVAALEFGRQRLRQLPISVRLVTELHRLLMDGVRGEEKQPGRLRDRAVWIGAPGSSIDEARFVPPPHPLVPDLLGDWERFVHDDGLIPPLVRAALMHYQFETIHPFNDGNGRIGRLLIPLFLMEREVLPTPLLYLSAYFERHRPQYYDQLLRVSATGDWFPWLEFFLAGVTEQSRDAIRRSRALRDLHDSYRQRVQEQRGSANDLRLVDELFRRPIVNRSWVAEMLAITVPGARNVLARLEEAGIISAVPGSRPQLYAARDVLRLIEE